MKFISHILILCLTGLCAAETETGYSERGLEYLLQNRDYERFDWYMDIYLRRYPDTATLYLMKGYRYFDEAVTFPQGTRNRLVGPSGGIPRKYPSYLVPDSLASAEIRLYPIWNKNLLHQAFSAMRMARNHQPNRNDISHGICQMALETEQEEIFLREIDTLATLFPDDSSIIELSLQFAERNLWTRYNQQANNLITGLLETYPSHPSLFMMRSRCFYARGYLDSSALYLRKAHEIQGDDPDILSDAIRIEAIRGNYQEASRLCNMRYALTDSSLDREQAIFFSLISDSLEALRLYNQICAQPSNDTSSVLGRLRKYQQTNRGKQNVFFKGNLFHLNFPLIQLYLLANGDRVEYHMHMAGAFYAVSQYDSAAYHNLNLLRNLSQKDNIGFDAGYNLAAEYFAAGRQMLSFQRFIHVYKHFYRQRNDSHLLYAMGVSYEAFGNLSDARYFYNRALAASDQKNTVYQLARFRLKTIKGPGSSQPH
ncbi:MAG: tetratricopeptide repeat protein [Chitinispirillaceae bacterium]